MKKIFLSIFITIAGITLIPLASYAATITDDFNDTTMDPSLWALKTVYETFPAEGAWNKGPFTLTEHDGLLNFATNDNGSAYGGRVKYNSTWTVDFSSDFKFYAQYNTSTASPDSSKGSLEIGLHDGTTEAFELWSGAYNSGTKNIYDAEIDLKAFTPIQTDRSTSGVIGISYDKAADRLDFIGGATENDVYAHIDEFTKYYGAYPGFQNLRVYLEGDAYNVNYTGSFDNFNFTGTANFPTVTPEPVSASLFLLGAGFFGIGKLRRNHKNQSKERS